MIDQFLRYFTVGISSNLFIYLAYLAITGLGAGHKTAMTMLYWLGVLVTYFINRRWTFNHAGAVSESLFRYIFTYVAGYVANWTGLYYLVDRQGFPHQAVQGILILMIATSIFLAQKFWVFSISSERTHNSAT
jgi:putative flippase GtrA